MEEEGEEEETGGVQFYRFLLVYRVPFLSSLVTKRTSFLLFAYPSMHVWGLAS